MPSPAALCPASAAAGRTCPWAGWLPCLRLCGGDTGGPGESGGGALLGLLGDVQPGGLSRIPVGRGAEPAGAASPPRGALGGDAAAAEPWQPRAARQSCWCSLTSLAQPGVSHRLAGGWQNAIKLSYKTESRRGE